MSQSAMLDRILSVLEAATGGPLSRRAIADRTGLPKATTNRLISALLEAGLLDETDEGLVLGRRLAVLAHHAHQAGAGFLDAAGPVMVDVHNATGHLVQLATLQGMQVTYVAKTYGRRTTPLNTSVGRHFPAHATGAGKVLLAHRVPRVTRNDLDPPQLIRLTPSTITSPAGLLSELRRTRRRGYAIDAEEFQIGRTSIAVPLTSKRHTIAALTLTAATADLHIPQAAATLTLARHEIQATIDLAAPADGR